MSHRLGTNQFVVGLTLNVLAIGLTAFLDAQIEPDGGVDRHAAHPAAWPTSR